MNYIEFAENERLSTIVLGICLLYTSICRSKQLRHALSCFFHAYQKREWDRNR